MVAGILADIYQFSEEDLRRCRAQSVINVGAWCMGGGR